MKRFTIASFLSTCMLSLLLSGSPDWHHHLYMHNNDYWRQRVEITVTNSSDRVALGDPVELKVGMMPGQLQLAGEQAQSLRLISGDGIQFKVRLTDPMGRIIRRGPVPTGSILTFPADVPAGEERKMYLYFDNPSAWAIADHFIPRTAILNGGFEETSGTTPFAWDLDWKEEGRSVSWVSNESHSGDKSLMTEIQEAKERSFGARQLNIHVMSGLRYSMEAWVKGESIEGDAGIRFEPGRLMSNRRNTTGEVITLSAGSGTFDWKKVRVEFTADEQVNVAGISTYLKGTGRVWMDDVSLKLLDDYQISASASPSRELMLAETGETETWAHPGVENHGYRVPVRVVNTSGTNLENGSVLVDLSESWNRLYQHVDPEADVAVLDGKQAIDHYRLGSSVFFRGNIPAGARKTFYIYFRDNGPKSAPGADEDFGALVTGKGNLLANGDFEENGPGWKRIGKRGLSSISDESKIGNHSLKVSLSAADTDTYSGYEQKVKVSPARDYILCGWVRSKGLEESDLRLKVDFLDAKGDPLESNKGFYSTDDDERVFGEWKVETLGQIRAVSAGISGDSDWTFVHGTIRSPQGASEASVQLVRDSRLRQGPSLTQDIKVKDSPGTVWFDGIYFSEVSSETALAMNMEWKRAGDLTGIAAWSVNPIEKVFRDDLPPSGNPGIKIFAAKNETEPLQLAIRSPEALTGLHLEIDPPQNEDGILLDNIEVGVVEYVPINVRSNYYRNRLPTWHLKYPTTQPGSDGWQGYWPDPIIPGNTFDLKGHTTQPVWIEIRVPQDAAPGLYKGNAWLVEENQVIKEIPFQVRVWDFMLPEKNNFAALYDLGFRSRGEFYENDKSEGEMFREYWKFMAKHRICSDGIHPVPELKIENGEISFDFTEHDKAAEFYFNELNMPFTYTPRLFYLFGWELPPREQFGEKAYPGEYPYADADRSKLRPEFKRAYQTALKIYWDHMKEKGWADKMVLYISDEPFTAPVVEPQMKALCDMIHEVDPDIPIYVSTWWYRKEYDGYIDVWGVANSGYGWNVPIPVSDLETIKSKGERILWTTDGRFCTDTPLNGIERMLPHYAFKYGAESYEFWNLTAYSFNPFEFGWHRFRMVSSAPGRFYWVRWPNGDGYLSYPGKVVGHDGPVPTIRLKQARDGVEDYEYMHLLKALIKEAESRGIETAKADKVLEEAMTLVNIPSAEGRYSTGFLPEPDLVQERMKKVAMAIEALQE